jgi:sulfur-carrier protein
LIVKVRFFASLREAVGLEQEGITLPAGSTIQSLVQALAVKHPGLETHFRARGVRFAVNRCYALPDAGLKDGDEVAFVPPVGGG